jgi:RNA polymerase sigma factor (sigma-70 family)
MSGTTSEQDRILEAVARFQRPLVSYAVGLIGDVDRARDVVQETFLRLCKQEPLSEEHLAPWLFRVCRNLSVDLMRKERRMTSIESVDREAASGAAEVVELRKDTSTILAMLDRLPKNQQEVLRLKFLHELSYKEISAITELSISNVGYLIHVGLKAIRERLAAAPRTVVEKQR